MKLAWLYIYFLVTKKISLRCVTASDKCLQLLVQFLRNATLKSAFKVICLKISRTVHLHIRSRNCQTAVRETPDFIRPGLWPLNSSNLKPVDYATTQERFYHTDIHSVGRWWTDTAADSGLMHPDQVMVNMINTLLSNGVIGVKHTFVWKTVILKTPAWTHS